MSVAFCLVVSDGSLVRAVQPAALPLWLQSTMRRDAAPPLPGPEWPIRSASDVRIHAIGRRGRRLRRDRGGAPARHGEGLVMASVKDLEDALDGAKASVDTLVGKVGQASAAGIDPADLDPVLAEITTLRSTVEALSGSIEPPKPAAPAAPAAGPAVTGATA